MYNINGISVINKLNNTENNTKKKIFVICIQGQGMIMQKVLRICDLIRASRYNIPNKEEFSDELKNLIGEINDKKFFLIETENSIKNFINIKEKNVTFKTKLQTIIYDIRYIDFLFNLN
jgi:hypothetical protein